MPQAMKDETPLNEMQPPQTRRERMAFFFSMDGGYTRFCKVLGVAFAILGLPFLLAGRIAMTTSKCTPQPRPDLGTTYFVPDHRWCPPGGGYINPKTEHFGDVALAVTVGLFGVFFLAMMVGLLGRQIFGDPPTGPDLRGALQSDDRQS